MTTPQPNKLTEKELQEIAEGCGAFKMPPVSQMLDHITAQENELKQYISILGAEPERDEALQYWRHEKAELKRQIAECQREVEQWKQRAITNEEGYSKLEGVNNQLQRQNAEMRGAIERELSNWDRDGKPCQCGQCAVCGLRKALSSNSGKGWVRVEDFDTAVSFVAEERDNGCFYKDNCPPFGTKHGTCRSCRAKEILTRLQAVVERANSPVTHNPEEDAFYERHDKEQK